MKRLLSALVVGSLICGNAWAKAGDLSAENILNYAFRADAVTDGRDTVASGGTAEVLTGTSSPTRYGELTVCAETDNTGIIVIGGSTVVASLGTRRGIPLAAGDCWTSKNSGTLSLWYVDTTVNGDGYTYAYTT